MRCLGNKKKGYSRLLEPSNVGVVVTSHLDSTGAGGKHVRSIAFPVSSGGIGGVAQCGRGYQRVGGTWGVRRSKGLALGRVRPHVLLRYSERPPISPPIIHVTLLHGRGYPISPSGFLPAGVPAPVRSQGISRRSHSSYVVFSYTFFIL